MTTKRVSHVVKRPGHLRRRVSVLSYGGDVLARWDGGSEGTSQFLAPHGICVDSLGSVYVCGVGEGKRVLKYVRKS